MEIGTWPRDHLDLCGPAYLRIDADGASKMSFVAMNASVDGRFAERDVDFDSNGADQGDQVTGIGWADLRCDGWLKGEIAYDNGDDTSFLTRPWPFSSPKYRLWQSCHLMNISIILDELTTD